MDQNSGTTPTDTATTGPDDSQPSEGAPAEQPGFGSRGRARRRARFLRKARELAYRDLGGLVFNLHQFGQRNDALVLGKLATLGHIDSELRTIEAAIQERRPITILREAGITACPRCAAIHGSEDRFCPNCGLPMTRTVEVSATGAPAGAPVSAPAAQAGASFETPPAGSPPSVYKQSDSSGPDGATAGASPAPAASGAASPHDAPGPQMAAPGLPGGETNAHRAFRQPEESTEIIHPQAPGS